jgi:microcin C transport system substrate-binding protein
MASVLLVSCGRRGADEPSGAQLPPVRDAAIEVEADGEVDPIASPEARRGGIINIWGGPFPKSLNAFLDYNSFSIEITGLLFEGLVGLHPTEDRPIGGLAKSWEISEDKRTFTFHLDPRARWSDGRPITAADLKFYYDTIMDPKNLTSLFRVDLSRFEPPEVVDDHTIRFTAREAHWMNFWTAGQTFAFPRHAWEGKNFNDINFDFGVVSGPYEIGDVKMNRFILLRRRGDWWGRAKRISTGRYNFDYIRYRPTDDRNKVLELLKKGDIDLYAIYTSEIWARQTDFPAARNNWIVRQTVFNREPKGFQGMAFNLRRPLFQDVRLRQALSLLFNREEMNEKLMYNSYFLLNCYYPDLYPDNRNPDAPFYGFDPDRARALLAEAGWKANAQGLLEKDGAPLRITILHHGEDLRHLSIFQQDLRRVGIEATIDLVSYATFTKRVQGHDFDLIWRNWGSVRLTDPEASWSSKQADEIATNNITGLRDPEIDALIEAQKTEMDAGKRKEILRKIDNRLVQIVPYILMWQADRHRLLYWNRFGTPRTVLDKFNREDCVGTYWWYDPERARALGEAMRAGTPLPRLPEEVRYSE